MSVPQICICIRLEAGGPRVYVDAVSDSEYLRLEDWIRIRPKLAELVRLAIELEHEETVA